MDVLRKQVLVVSVDRIELLFAEADVVTASESGSADERGTGIPETLRATVRFGCELPASR
jgi:hypothetical protein